MLIGTSWKMHKTQAQARAWVDEVVAAQLPLTSEDHLFVIPSFTAIATVKEVAQDTLLVGAQNVHQEEAGAFTGEISAPMLAELGCELVEIGHSERREYFNETDEIVAQKAKIIEAHGMRPLICIGEDLATRQTGDPIKFVTAQATTVLAQVNNPANCLLAYEPIWSIGVDGIPATPEQIAPVHQSLRENHPQTPILYGGSVNLDNAAALSQVAGVAGLFIGRAALEASNFIAIVKACLKLP